MEENLEMVAARLHYLVGSAFTQKSYRKPSDHWDTTTVKCVGGQLQNPWEKMSFMRATRLPQLRSGKRILTGSVRNALSSTGNT
jgi:hypothetical protein